jgi:hypothetical protein
MQKAHLPHFRPVSALLVSRRAVAMSADSSNSWKAPSFSAILLSFSATILSFSSILSLNSLTVPKYQPTIWKKQVIYNPSNTQQGLTVLSNKLTRFDCCGLRSTRSYETARTYDRMTDVLTIRIDCVNKINGNALSGYQESNLGESGDNSVHNSFPSRLGTLHVFVFDQSVQSTPDQSPRLGKGRSPRMRMSIIVTKLCPFVVVKVGN